MDALTVDTILGVRYYCYFIISHKTREIVQYGVTAFPVKEYVRQQLIDLKEKIEMRIYLIYDGSGEL